MPLGPSVLAFVSSYSSLLTQFWIHIYTSPGIHPNESSRVITGSGPVNYISLPFMLLGVAWPMTPGLVNGSETATPMIDRVIPTSTITILSIATSAAITYILTYSTRINGRILEPQSEAFHPCGARPALMSPVAAKVWLQRLARLEIGTFLTIW